MTLRSSIATSLVLALLPALAACDDLALAPPGPDEAGDDGALATVAAPLVSAPANQYVGGFVRFRIDGAGRWYTGLLIKPPGATSELTHTIAAIGVPHAAFPTCLPEIEVERGWLNSSGNSSVTTASVVNVLGERNGLMLLSLDQPLDATRAAALATTPPAPNTEMRCYGYRPNSGALAWIAGNAGSNPGQLFSFHEIVGQELDGDAPSWVCLDLALGTVYGWTSWADGMNVDYAVSAAPLRDWIHAQAAVASVAAPTWWVRPQAVMSERSQLCMDIPNATFADAPVNHYTCHDGGNQDWYWRSVTLTRNGAAATRYLLQNAWTGKCVSDTPTGVRQVACSSGDARQLFERTPQAAAGLPYGKIDVRLRNDATGQCLTTINTTPSTAVVAATCAATTAAWRIDDPSLLTWCSPFGAYPWF